MKFGSRGTDGATFVCILPYGTTACRKVVLIFSLNSPEVYATFFFNYRKSGDIVIISFSISLKEIAWREVNCKSQGQFFKVMLYVISVCKNVSDSMIEVICTVLIKRIPQLLVICLKRQ